MTITHFPFYRASFQDVMCGYFSLDEISKDSAVSFSESLREFSLPSESRHVRSYQGSHFAIYTNSFQEDIFDNSDFFSVFVGFASGLTRVADTKRILAQHFSLLPNWQAEDFNQFVDSRFAGLVIDQKNRSIRLGTDFFGKRKMFYQVVDRVCYFSSEFKVLLNITTGKDSPEVQIDRQSLRNYLACGTTIGSSTIALEIKSVPLQAFVEFSEEGIQVHHFKKETPSSSRELDSRKVFEALKNVLRFLTTDLEFKFADLTGGADTRLTLQALLELATPIIYTCENMDLEDGTRLAYDFHIMNLLKEKFDLPVEFNFDGYRSNKKLRRTIFDTHREYDGDIYHQCLSGMFGGEFFGGWAYEHFFSTGQIAHFRKLDQETLKRFPIGFFDGTVSFEEQMNEQCHLLSTADPKALLAITMFYSSPLYFRKNEKIWLEPYIITARKISAFLGDAVIRSLDVVNLGEQVSRYKFYLKLYKDCAPQMMGIPFHTYFATLFPEQLTDICSLIPPKPEENSARIPLTEADLIAQKMEVLSEFLSSTPHGLLQMPQVDFSQKSSW